MYDGRKLVLSPFTGRKKRKAWNKTREKYIPEERTQNSADTDMVSYYKTRGMVRSILIKNFANSTGKHLCWSFFLIRCRP